MPAGYANIPATVNRLLLARFHRSNSFIDGSRTRRRCYREAVKFRLKHFRDVEILLFIDQVRLTKGPSWHLVSAGRLCEYPRHRESTPTRSISSVKFVHRRKQDTSPLLSGSSEVSPEAFSRRRILLFIDQVRLTKGPSWHLVSAGRLCEYPRHRESTPTRSISSVKFVHRRKQDTSPLLSGSSEVSPEAFSRRRILLFIGQIRSSTKAGHVAVAIGKQ